MSRSLNSTTTLRQILEGIVGSVPFGIIVLSNEGEIELINGTGAKLLDHKDLSPSDLIDTHFETALMHLDEAKEKYVQLILSGRHSHFQLQLTTPISNRELDITCKKLLRGALIIIEDLTEKNLLQHQNSHDDLTGLGNRQSFEKSLLEVIEDQREHISSVVIFIDLDNFKPINDIAGHDAGDETLKAIATTLLGRVREKDIVARLGGDEFAILLHDCPINKATDIAKSILKKVEELRFHFKNKLFRLTLSAGLYPITPNCKDSPSTVINAADIACRSAKQSGGSKVYVLTESNNEFKEHITQVDWLEKITQAIENDNFILYGQKIEGLDQAHNNHYEVLIRMQDDDGKIIAPDAFISAAERFNMMSQIDKWVIRESFRLADKDHILSINLSGQTVSDPSIAEYILSLRSKYDIDPSKIIFEVTETAAIQNSDAAMTLLDTLSTVGFHFSLDDFGTGLSSFSYLKDMPVSTLKIDGVFIRDIETDPISHAMVKSITEIANVMGIKTVAEYVENNSIYKILKDIGINYAQGFFVHKPEALESIIIHNSSASGALNA